MIQLGINIDHCATLREARYRDYPQSCSQMVEPDPLACALAAERAGADGITVHLREDCRHIQVSDVHRLRANLQTRLNLEMACTQAMTEFALEVKPDSVCLVPENREEVTTEGGLDVLGKRSQIQETLTALKAAGIFTSLFIEADTAQIEASAELGTHAVELHTGAWANAYYGPKRQETLQALYKGAQQAHSQKLCVHAGHGINYVNIAEICGLPHLRELNIGHSVISRALLTGIEAAVQTMRQSILAGSQAKPKA